MDYPAVDFSQILSDVTFPRGAIVKMNFPRPREKNISSAIKREFNKSSIKTKLLPGENFGEGKRVAVAVGSRGIASLAETVSGVIKRLKKAGAHPFIVPAMGSHGGATAEGQIDILSKYGITEETVKAPVVSTMDTLEIGKLSSGSAVNFSKDAYFADGIVVINRVKPHTALKGDLESGIIKMLAIGLGKHKGAETAHKEGFKRMGERLEEASGLLFNHIPEVMGVAILENAYEEVAKVEVIENEQILHREKELLSEAKNLMGKLPYSCLDVLVVDEMGKNVSGAGIDPNVTGKYAFPWLTEGPSVNKLAVLRLTPQSMGNAVGMGLADITCRGLINDVDIYSTYLNSVTSTSLTSAKVPIVMPSEKEAVALAMKTCNNWDINNLKMIRIKNTLELGKIWVSEALLKSMNQAQGEFHVIEDPVELSFNHSNELINFY